MEPSVLIDNKYNFDGKLNDIANKQIDVSLSLKDYSLIQAEDGDIDEDIDEDINEEIYEEIDEDDGMDFMVNSSPNYIGKYCLPYKSKNNTKFFHYGAKNKNLRRETFENLNSSSPLYWLIIVVLIAIIILIIYMIYKKDRNILY